MEQADWVLCPGCRSIVYGKRWARNLGVCPECARHAQLTAAQRLDQLLDAGSSDLLDQPVTAEDPLGFTDTVPYPDRLARARADTGMHDAVLCAQGTIDGVPVVVAAMDFRFIGGSLGSAAGEAITLAAEAALARHVPLVIVTASGGARMQEGTLSLMQMAKTSAALAELDEAGVLTISLITDPTFGGVAASFASLCDVIIAEPGARLGFAGRRVIEQTIRQRLPADFQTAEFLLARGFLDMVVARPAVRGAISRLLRTTRPPAVLPAGVASVVRDPGLLPEHDPWRQVRAARALDRPTTLDYLAMITTDFQELRGDRVAGDCPAVAAGTARLSGVPVVVIGQQKGHTAAELADRNFGMPSPAGYRKAARAMRLAAKLGVPVVTLVDTPGADPGARSEETGQSIAIAENLRLMASLPVPVVTVVTGEGGSGGALALAVASRVLMWSDSVYSVISAEGCAAILWKDASAAPRAAEALRVNARELLRLGIVDGVLPEPDGGVAAAPEQAAERLRDAVLMCLDELAVMDADELVKDRRARFRRFGAAPELDAVYVMREAAR